MAAIQARPGQTRPSLPVVRYQAPMSTDAASAHIATIMKTAKTSRLPDRVSSSATTASCRAGTGSAEAEKSVSLLENSIRTGTCSPPICARNAMSVS